MNCPHCAATDLRPCGYFRPDVGGRTRTAIGINDGEDATRQRVQCRNCKKYFMLPPLERIEARPGRPKVSRSVCDCGSSDLRRAGWHEDGRQHVRCNRCQKEFALPLGMLAATPEKLDSIGRRIHFSALAEHEFRLPDANEEASVLLAVAKSEGDFEAMRQTIAYSESQKRCLQILCDSGMLASAYVTEVLSFRDRVLEKFNCLVNIELQMLVESYEKKEAANSLPQIAPAKTCLTSPSHALPSSDTTAEPNHSVTNRTSVACPAQGTVSQIAEKES
jgi:hypothetical protein